MRFTRKAEVGDVITSPKFAILYATGKDFLYVGWAGASLIKDPPDISAFANAEFVVEEVEKYSDEDGCGDAYLLKARRLSADGTYEPTNELIAFLQQADSGLEPCIDEVCVVGKMRLVKYFIREK